MYGAKMPLLETLFPLGISRYLIGELFVGCAVGFLFVTTGLVGGMNTFFTSTWSFGTVWADATQ